MNTMRSNRPICVVISVVIFTLLVTIWSLNHAYKASSDPFYNVVQEIRAVPKESLKQNGDAPIQEILGKRLENCEGNVRPERTRLRNELWHLQNFSGNEEIMVFSAYYDDRACFNGKSFLRLLTVTTVVSQSSLVCQIWYDDFTKPLISNTVSENTGRGLNINQVHHQERLYSCEVPNIPDKKPLFVSLVKEKCAKSSILVPVTAPERTRVHDLGICVVVAYGDIPSAQLIEWVELNQILGAKEINVYDSRVGPKTRAVFQYYRKKGLMRVYASAPSINNWCKWCQKLSVIAALNDCMYRNMYRYEHLMVIDFDEFIIPVKDKTIPEVLHRMAATWRSPPPGYLFANTYFFLDTAPKYSTPAKSITQRYVARQPPSPAGYSPKSVIDPRHCMVMQNHFCMKRTPDVSGAFTLHVKPEFAKSHHYKKCHFGTEKCKGLLKDTHEDEGALKYGAELNKTFPLALKGLSKYVT